jgi:hypothetical protein
MTYDPTNVPRPQSVEDYIDAYKANLDEARYELQAAAQRVQVLRDQGLIADVPDPDTRELRRVCKGETAKKAWGVFVRWSSDVEHWRARLREASADGFELPRPFKQEPRERTAEDVARELEEWRAAQ